MNNLGVASEAIDLVYQLNTEQEPPADLRMAEGNEPLETLLVTSPQPGDIVVDSLAPSQQLTAFRFQRLILIKNSGDAAIIVRGQQIRPGDFARIFAGPARRHLRASHFPPGFRLLLQCQEGCLRDPAVSRVWLGWRRLRRACPIEGEPPRDQVRARGYASAPSGKPTARLHGEPLHAGDTVTASLQDKIQLGDESDILLSDLRRRARDMGGRFELQSSKAKYLVSNNPDLLKKGDILLSPGAAGDVLLSIHCDFEQKSGELEVIASVEPILLGGQAVRKSAQLQDGDTITIGKGQFLACHFGDRIIEEQRNLISHLEVTRSEFQLRPARARAREHHPLRAARRDGLYHRAERLRQEHAAAHARRTPAARLRRGPHQRALALRAPRQPPPLHLLHPPRGCLRPTSHRRGEHRLRRGHPLPPPHLRRAEEARRHQTRRTRPERTPPPPRRRPTRTSPSAAASANASMPAST